MIRVHRLLAVCGALGLAAVASGCAYTVWVRGVREKGMQLDLERGLPIAVARHPQAPPGADRGLAAKIERILGQRGYRVVPESEAAMVLFFDYEIKDMLARKYLMPISGPSGGVMTTASEGPFIHTLTLSLVDAGSYRDETRKTADVLWAGGAVLNSAPVDSPKFDDLLLVAAFDHFGEDTGTTLKTGMTLNDRRARQLRSE
jgi:hypothetical protein